MPVQSVALNEAEAYLVALIQDPSGIDLAEFMWEDPMAHNEEKIFRAWDFQHSWWRDTSTLALDQCARAVGKALAFYEPVLTPNGWTPIKALEVGDLVYGSDGNPYPVLGVYPQGQREMFEVVFSDGASLTVDGEHLWSVSRYRRSWKTLTTNQLLSDGIISGRGERKFRIPVADPINHPTRSLPIDPYTLGALLGDGGFTETGLKFSTADPEIFDYMELPERIAVRPLGGPNYSLTCVDFKRGQRHPLVAPLREMGLWGCRSPEKFIPDEYMLGDIEQRKRLLAGLLDTDGHAGSSPTFSSTSLALAQGVQELVRSLGGVASMTSRQTYYAGKARLPSWRVTIKLPFNPFFLSRKRESLYVPKHKKTPVRSIVSIEPVGSLDAVCIEVGSPDHLFVARDCTVTHNTQSIILRAWAFPIQHPGAEMVVTAPELVHLDPLTSRIEDRIKETRITKELLPNRVGRGFKHRPFQVNFTNSAKILGRIPQRDGKGVKGLHPLRLELDEAQDFPEAGWVELVETLRHGEGGAQWRAHGVSRGVRDQFYRHSQPGSGWSVHRLTGMHRPTWSDQERLDKIEMYGSRDSPDYKRNILGVHGDATNPLFVLHRLMACVDEDAESDYNRDIYYHRRISDEMVADRSIVNLIDIPGSHKEWTTTWAGMDVGMTNHPSEILVFGEESARGKDEPVSRLLARFHLERIRSSDQRKIIEFLFEYYKFQQFTLDRTGLGLPLFQELQDGAPKIMDRIVGYNADEKVVIGWEEYESWEKPEDYEIKARAKDYGYDLLRRYVDTKRLILPWDRELLGEWQGQTWTREKNETSPYGKRSYAQGQFHTLDAAGMFIVGKELHALNVLAEMRDIPEEVPIVFV